MKIHFLKIFLKLCEQKENEKGIFTIEQRNINC